MTTWPGNDVLSKLLASKTKRVKASFSLSEPNYLIFRQLCKSKGLGMSEVMDIAISDFLERYGEKSE